MKRLKFKVAGRMSTDGIVNYFWYYFVNFWNPMRSVQGKKKFGVFSTTRLTIQNIQQETV